MAKLLEFYKINEDEFVSDYDVVSDGFNAKLKIDKIYKKTTLNFTSTRENFTDLEMEELKKDFVEWVINKHTKNLTLFPNIFNHNS